MRLLGDLLEFAVRHNGDEKTLFQGRSRAQLRGRFPKITESGSGALPVGNRAGTAYWDPGNELYRILGELFCRS